MKPFDNYEIHGIYECSDNGRTFCEQVTDDQATFWTLYGHINGEGVQTIGDFDTKEHAEEVFQRITGIPFTGSYKAESHLRIMHAGPKLLEACDLVQRAHVGDGVSMADAVDACLLAIAEATGRSA
jgi:hypothetical protein